ncbi:aminotransferase class I/II-fold pyridoxal phosphate-dependent enzyme [Psychromarinibacter sp. S121]|uniref:aminotransferase class I/II-fold pyridoxal phosphate-dependent enzyme n=1 Tax=Psychromarinibacter sp. S121 TaxID=3415127 RepID=UPI003C7D694D
MTDDSIDTFLAQPFGGGEGSVTPPIYQSSLFTFDDFSAFEARMSGQGNRTLYSRVQNPTQDAFEKMMAKLEGGESAVGFASGMAAISSVLFAFLKPGDRLACVEHVYPDAYRLMERMLGPWGVEVTYHSVTELQDNPDTLKGAALAYLESPNSMMMQVMDLRKVADHAKAHGCLTVVDNSWATPVFQTPLALGIDIVLHSASKYICGHSDTVAGVVVASDEHIARIRDLTLPLLGGKLAPFEAWLLVRGLRTLPARMREHQRTADLFVDRLGARPEVVAVNSPGPNSVPGLKGRSGLMSIEFTKDVDVRKFADALNLFHYGVSWGGFESLIVPTAITLAQAGPKNSLQAFGVPDTMVRISLGLEDAEALWADFESALVKAGS